MQFLLVVCSTTWPSSSSWMSPGWHHQSRAPNGNTTPTQVAPYHNCNRSARKLKATKKKKSDNNLPWNQGYWLSDYKGNKLSTFRNPERLPSTGKGVHPMWGDTVQSNFSASSWKDFTIIFFLSLENLLRMTGHLINNEEQVTRKPGINCKLRKLHQIN